MQKMVRSLRAFRQWHRWVGVSLLVFVLISSLTGLLLAWKKNVDFLQPPTQSAPANDQPWLSITQINQIALDAFEEAYPGQNLQIDRLDVRPQKGVVKVLLDSYWEVQVDGYSGQVLSIARRHSDWIEQVHDGSILSDTFKLWSMNALGAGLLLVSLTGGWMWWGPKQIRKRKRKHKSTV
uniref:PepSY-associated TM helix domain-containing protein n=1 Tax=Roseihalotalea indica TaxID=2867963 RepID=A0AA49JGN2_9BACT|nr:PepSY-associated TM helix domain-containing protein [Tunicatimonas sp. TK19036]